MALLSMTLRSLSLVNICLLAWSCASTGVDPSEQDAGFAGVPENSAVEDEFGFGENLSENEFAENEFAENEFENPIFNEEFPANDASFGEEEAAGFNSDTSNEFAENDFLDNFNVENNDALAANSENFLENNEFFAAGENNVNNDELFANDNQLFANENPIADAEPLEEGGDFNMFANNGAQVNNVVVNEFEQNAFATDTTLVAQAPMQPVMEQQSGGRVKYVISTGSALYSEPNGQVVKELLQGDHPLVFSEGEWARTSDGYYVASESLTEQAVPREKPRSMWSN